MDGTALTGVKNHMNKNVNTILITSVGLCALSIISAPFMSSNAYAQTMTSNEARGATISGKWREGTGIVTKGADGKVIFLFGEVQPSVICSPLQVCDIELEGGEIVRDVLVGDTVRWKVEPATSGDSGGQAIHLIVKPSEPGLITSMVVTTSRRTYHIQLKSHPSQYMARVGFDYQDGISNKLTDVNSRMEAVARTSGGVPAEGLNFSYILDGRASWRPTRVYSDGQKTYIQFPTSISAQDAPVLFIVSGDQKRIVNYRMKSNMMIVDYDVERAVLISGIGWHKQKITIRKGA
jgi:type IV secretion system protein TrbG